MNRQTSAPRGRDYLQLLGERWVVILLATVLSGFAGWLSWETGDREYYAFTQVLVVTPGGAMPSDAFYGNFNAKAWVPTYVELAKSRQVTERTLDQLGLDESPEDLAQRVSVGFGTGTVLQITVTGEDPYLTAETANAVTINMIGLSREMETVNTGGTELVLVDPSTPPIRQGSLKNNIIVATLIGLALSAVLVVVVGLLGDRVLGKSQAVYLINAEMRGRNQ